MRKEYAAFCYRDNIIWLAYYRTGGGKEDTAYTEGWSSELSGAARHAETQRILDAQFGIGDSGRPFLADGNGRIVGVGSIFIGCSQVFFDSAMDAGIKAIMARWFQEAGTPCLEVEAPLQSLEEINARWEEPMGVACTEDSAEDIGQNRALSVMHAGLEALSPGDLNR